MQVVDRTNIDQAQRRPFIELAQKAGAEVRGTGYRAAAQLGRLG